jgi:hypothetical protein
VFYGELNDIHQLKWHRRRCAEWEYNIVQYNENDKSIEDRAKDYVAAQERNPVDTQNENASDYKTDEKVNEQPKHGGGEATCECGIVPPSAMERRVEARVLRDALVIVVIAMVPFQILGLHVFCLRHRIIQLRGKVCHQALQVFEVMLFSRHFHVFQHHSP